jgi:hypothetical protein
MDRGTPGYSRQRVHELRGDPPVSSKRPPKSATGGNTPRKQPRERPDRVPPDDDRRAGERKPRGNAGSAVTGFALGDLFGKRGSKKTHLGPLDVDANALVTAGFLICAVTVAAEAFTGTDGHAEDSDQTWGHHFLVREIAVCVTFLALAVMATLGKAGRMSAAGLSVLVLLATLYHSADLLTFVAGKFSDIGASGTAPEGNAGAGQQAAGGAVQAGQTGEAPGLHHLSEQG